MPAVFHNGASGVVQLSPNFFLSEFVESEQAERLGIDNTPNPVIIMNLFKLAKLLEEIRALLGNVPVVPTSGYRCPALNKAVGGSVTSEHMTGSACDFRALRFGTALQVCKKISESNIKFGQLIWEGTWTHISLPDGVNDGQVMRARFVNGKPHYLKGLV